MSGQRAEVDAILALFPPDATGHATDCGYDGVGIGCGCYTLPTRLAAAVDQIATARVKAALTEAADAIEAARPGSERDGEPGNWKRGERHGRLHAARIVRAHSP